MNIEDKINKNISNHKERIKQIPKFTGNLREKGSPFCCVYSKQHRSASNASVLFWTFRKNS